MRLIPHILIKDLRRLWPVAAATSLLLGVLSNADRWRMDWVPSPLEGWMNLLLTGSWACLAALAVLQEPMVGEREFWMTKPYRVSALLLSKAAFVALTDSPSVFAGGRELTVAARLFSRRLPGRTPFKAVTLLWRAGPSGYGSGVPGTEFHAVRHGTAGNNCRTCHFEWRVSERSSISPTIERDAPNAPVRSSGRCCHCGCMDTVWLPPG